MATPQILAWKYSLHLPHSYSQPLPASRNFSSEGSFGRDQQVWTFLQCVCWTDYFHRWYPSHSGCFLMAWVCRGGRHRRFRDNEEFLWACFASVSGRLRLEIGISDSLATLLIFLCFVKWLDVKLNIINQNVSSCGDKANRFSISPCVPPHPPYTFYILNIFTG